MDELRARVISQSRELYRLSSEKGEILAEVSGRYRYEAKENTDFPAVGDYVISTWPEDGSHGIISLLFPRKSSFIRKGAGRESSAQIVAANIDVVFLCMSLNNDFNLRRMERYLAATWESGASPVILLTKKDLCPDPEAAVLQAARIAPGTRILAISVMDLSSDLLLSVMEPGKTYAFVGSSGVGKSTLINHLMDREHLRTDGLRNDDKGHHTTTHRELICLPTGAFVIDTPGMRELGLFDHEEGLDTVFSEIDDRARRCRFPDCSHDGEPGCAVAEALALGILSPERLEAFRKLQKENAYGGERSAYLKEKKAKFKKIAKTNRKRR